MSGPEQQHFGFVDGPMNSIPIVPTRISKIIAKNKSYLHRFLAAILTGNTFSLSKEEIERCNSLSERASSLTDEELAAEVEILQISTREHPELPKWAKLALVKYRELHALFQSEN